MTENSNSKPTRSESVPTACTVYNGTQIYFSKWDGCDWTCAASKRWTCRLWKWGQISTALDGEKNGDLPIKNCNLCLMWWHQLPDIESTLKSDPVLHTLAPSVEIFTKKEVKKKKKSDVTKEYFLWWRQGEQCWKSRIKTRDVIFFSLWVTHAVGTVHKSAWQKARRMS